MVRSDFGDGRRACGRSSVGKAVLEAGRDAGCAGEPEHGKGKRAARVGARGTRFGADVVADAELAEPVFTPNPYCAVSEERETVVSAGRDRGGAGQPAHRGRGLAARVAACFRTRARADAQLTDLVRTPGLDSAVGHQRQAEVKAARERARAAQAADRRGNVASCGGAVAQLPIVVVAPGTTRPSSNRARPWSKPAEMPVTPLSPVISTGLVRRARVSRHAGFRPRVGAIAELAEAVFAPGLDRAVVEQREAGVRSR